MNDAIKFEWTISLGQITHLVVLVFYLWWIQRRMFQKMKEADDKLNQINLRTIGCLQPKRESA